MLLLIYSNLKREHTHAQSNNNNSETDRITAVNHKLQKYSNFIFYSLPFACACMWRETLENDLSAAQYYTASTHVWSMIIHFDFFNNL